MFSINNNFASSTTVPKECSMNKNNNVGSDRGLPVIWQNFFYKPTFDIPKSRFIINHCLLSLYEFLGLVIEPAYHWFSSLLIETKCWGCFDKRNMGSFAFNTAVFALHNVVILMCYHLNFNIHWDIFQVCLSILLSQANYQILK